METGDFEKIVSFAFLFLVFLFLCSYYFFMNYLLSNTTVSYSVGWAVEVDIEGYFNAMSLHPLRLDFVFAFQVCRAQAHLQRFALESLKSKT